MREVLEHLSKKFNEEIKKLEDDLGSGIAKDHGEYKWVCGIIRGFKNANGFLATLSDEMREDDDE